MSDTYEVTCDGCGARVFTDLSSPSLPLPVRNLGDGSLHTCGENEGEAGFNRGDLVWARTDPGYWRRGIVTDVFRAPITDLVVVVVGGEGYYTGDVMPDTGDVPEPQSLKVTP